MTSPDSQSSTRLAATWLAAHVDVAREAGDALREVQDRFGLRVVDAAKLLTDAHRRTRKKAARGSIVSRLLDSDSPGSYPFAEHLEFEPDRTAPPLGDVGTVKIGRYRIPRLGLGCMRLVSKGGKVGRKVVSAIGLPHSPEANRHALLNAVEVSGVRYLDISRGYGPWPGAGEGLMRDWLAPFRKDLLVASKVGYRRLPTGGWQVDLDPAFLRGEILASHRQFGRPIPLLYLVTRSTPATPVVRRPRRLARSLAPLLEAQAQGLVENIGIANVTLADFEELRDAGPWAVVQNRFSLASLALPAERAVLERTRALKIPFVTWGLFGEGVQPAPQPHPRVAATAEALGATVGEVTLALMLAAGPHVVPLPGPGRRATIESCVAGANLRLAPAKARVLLDALGLVKE